MAGTESGNARKTSRLLAALDEPELPFVPAPFVVPGVSQYSAFNPLKRPFDFSDDDEEEEIYKKCTTGVFGTQTNLFSVPGSSRSAAVADANFLSQAVAHSQRHPSVQPGPHSSRSFALNYDHDSAVTRLDVGGNDQAQRMAEFVTRTIDNASHGLTVQTAMEKLGLRHNKDIIPGMEVRLLPHQVIGVSWMINQEKKTKDKGGIMADDMGLGKTVQMIATMVINQPDEDEKHRTTLVVVPAALLLQWKEEIESKSNDIFSVHIQHGKYKLKYPRDLEEYDVVITTYQTLNMDFAIPGDLDEGEEIAWLRRNGGPLARTKWYRVVADEAQFIRNRATRSSKALAMLTAKYRWCLTGTPVTNTLADIYGLLRFGRFRPWNDWTSFNEYIGKVQLSDAPLAGLRTQEILKSLLIRRTKNSELEGKPILQLPPKHIEMVTVEFSEDERGLYESFEIDAQRRINKYIKENTIVKNHSVVLVMILRLRQLCCHPHLILSHNDEYEDPTMLIATDAEKELARATKVMGTKWVQDMKRQYLERAKLTRSDYDDSDDVDETCPSCGDLFVNDNARVLGCGHEACFDCLLELSSAPPVHDGIFGYGDEASNLQVEKEFESAVAKGLRPCPTCKKMMDFRNTHTFKSSAFQPSEEEFLAATRRVRPSVFRKKPDFSSATTTIKKSPKKEEPEEFMDPSESDGEDLPDITSLLKDHDTNSSAKLSQVKKKKAESSDDEDESDVGMLESAIDKYKSNGKSKDANKPSQAVISTWRKADNDMQPSAKMKALIEYLKQWEPSGDKTICYSQWTSMLDLVETIFARYGIQSLRYDGRMNREAREIVLARFRRSGGPRVILISTKCGGVGLNLVSANRIVNLDLSWNYASESQAYDRVHRLGQEKEVFIKRLIVKDTIEERMLQLQETKVGLADAALGEGGGVKLHKLSVRELKLLFGMAREEPQPPPPPPNQDGVYQLY